MHDKKCCFPCNCEVNKPDFERQAGKRSMEEMSEISEINRRCSGRLTGDVWFSGRLPIQSIEIRVPVAL